MTEARILDAAARTFVEAGYERAHHPGHPRAGRSAVAALVTAAVLVVVSRHLLRIDELATAPPEQIAELLRPCLRSLTCADSAPSAS